MKLVVLPTDLLFLLVLTVLATLVLHILNQRHLRRPWREVCRRRSAMASGLILLAYLGIAILDSIRFQPESSNAANPSGEAVSLLDSLLQPMGSQQERTYSAPLAITGYTREMIRAPDGCEQWQYPRLKFAGQHLREPDGEALPDIGWRILQGTLRGLSYWSCLTILWLVTMGLSNRSRPGQRLLQAIRGQSEPPWGTGCLTVLMICIAAGLIHDLGPHYHILGTDKIGEDILYGSLKSIRTGLLMGTLTTLATLPLALALGILAGYCRGWVDDLIQYIYTLLNSIPHVLLIAATMLIMQSYMARHEAEFTSPMMRADFRLMALCLILGLTSWTGLCRLLRAETLKLREMEYVQAARVLGTSRGMILIRHIMPNLFHLVLISVAMDFSSLVLAEAVLTYVNIGVDPSTYSWGNMINNARLEMAREPLVWWPLASAFAFMFILVLSANLFADALRDALDPYRQSGA